MNELRLSPDFALPTKALDYPFALLGVTGSGKSNAGAVIVESLYDAELPFVVVDPTSTWWGVRSGKDGGKRGGLEVPIFGRPAGPHTDLPLERGAGKFLAELIVERRLSCVLDLFHLGDVENDADKYRFLVEFGRTLYQRNTKRLYLLLEEADDYAPQSPQGVQAQCLHVWKTIVRRGRSKGLVPITITQRSAAVHKDVLTQTQTLLVMRTTSPNDLKAVKGWLEAHTQDVRGVLDSLPRLKDGEAWILSRFLEAPTRVSVRRRRTYDSAATPGLEEGDRPGAKLADIDVAALSKEMASAIERAKAEDPRELKRRIAELERELKAKPAAAPAVKPPKVIERLAVKEAHVRRLEELARRCEVAGERSLSAAVKLGDEARDVRAALAAARDTQRGAAGRILAADGRSPAAVPHSAPVRPTPVVPRAPRANAGEGALGAGERRILAAVAQHDGGVTRDQLTVLVGYKRSSRDTYLQRLRANGLVGEQGGQLYATTHGVEALGPDFEPLPTGEALRDYWMAKLPEGERKILTALSEAYPQAVARDALDESIGYKRSSRDTYLQRLRSRRLVDDAGRGQVRASRQLFEGA